MSDTLINTQQLHANVYFTRMNLKYIKYMFMTCNENGEGVLHTQKVRLLPKAFYKELTNGLDNMNVQTA